ncbi:MAG: ATP-binding cassette protein [Chitinophagaceae bacterium]|nr:ATP-binding cassette protein [Chitinophagaceae bacterium]
MRISVSDAGKRFNRDWIFRNFTYQFESANAYAITGPNGSGKSTLLQVLSGSMQLSSGSINWQNNIDVDADSVFNSIAIAAPYLEVVEEMTAVEFLKFHSSFKPMLPGISIGEILSITGLEKAAEKQIRYYSSGMKQRIKLAQAIFSDVAILLLDEPCTNLDTTGYDLYHQLIESYCKNRMIIVSSNDVNEFPFCKEKILITDYK